MALIPYFRKCLFFKNPAFRFFLFDSAQTPFIPAFAGMAEKKFEYQKNTEPELDIIGNKNMNLPQRRRDRKAAGNFLFPIKSIIHGSE